MFFSVMNHSVYFTVPPATWATTHPQLWRKSKLDLRTSKEKKSENNHLILLCNRKVSCQRCYIQMKPSLLLTFHVSHVLMMVACIRFHCAHNKLHLGMEFACKKVRQNHLSLQTQILSKLCPIQWKLIQWLVLIFWVQFWFSCFKTRLPPF